MYGGGRICGYCAVLGAPLFIEEKAPLAGDLEIVVNPRTRTSIALGATASAVFWRSLATQSLTADRYNW